MASIVVTVLLLILACYKNLICYVAIFSCRYLKELGYEVTYVRNFTDVDDKVRTRLVSYPS